MLQLSQLYLNVIQEILAVLQSLRQNPNLNGALLRLPVGLDQLLLRQLKKARRVSSGFYCRTVLSAQELQCLIAKRLAPMGGHIARKFEDEFPWR
ncbi:hypothetical protein ACWEL8_08880 [Streptomyces sp. NPDC004690]